MIGRGWRIPDGSAVFLRQKAISLFESKCVLMARKSQDDPQFEISFYEKILARSPDFVEALICLGGLYTKEGLFEKGLAADQRLACLRPEDETVFYNLACSYSLVNDVAAAEQAMRRAIELGYEDWDHLARDPDLVNLLNSDTFRSYFLGLRARCGGVVERGPR